MTIKYSATLDLVEDRLVTFHKDFGALIGIRFGKEPLAKIDVAKIDIVEDDFKLIVGEVYGFYAHVHYSSPPSKTEA